MTSASSEPADYQDRISRREFEQLVSVRGEGDEWDFKQTLSGLVGASTKRKAIENAYEPLTPDALPDWTTDSSLISWLDTLGR